MEQGIAGARIAGEREQKEQERAGARQSRSETE